MPLKTQFIRQYTALLNQTTTDAPTATELHNTFIDTITWARTTAGTYTATFATVTLEASKTIVEIQNNMGPNYAMRGYWTAANQITIQTWTIDFPDGEPTSADEVLSNTAIDIKLYYLPMETVIPFTYPTSES